MGCLVRCMGSQRSQRLQIHKLSDWTTTNNNCLFSNQLFEVKLLSRVQLFATPWTVAYQAPPSMGFSRQEYRSGLPSPSPGDLPDPGIESWSPAFQADTLTSENCLDYICLWIFFTLIFSSQNWFLISCAEVGEVALFAFNFLRYTKAWFVAQDVVYPGECFMYTWEESVSDCFQMDCPINVN